MQRPIDEVNTRLERFSSAIDSMGSAVTDRFVQRVYSRLEPRLRFCSSIVSCSRRVTAARRWPGAEGTCSKWASGRL